MEKMTCSKLKQKIRLFREKKRNFDVEIETCVNRHDAEGLKLLTENYGKLEKSILNLRGSIAKERYDKFEYMEELSLECTDGDVTNLTILANGELVSISKGGIIKMWNLESGNQIRNVKSFADQVSSVTAMRNGDFITTDSNGVVMIRDGTTGEEKAQITGAYKYIKAAIEAPGERVVFGNDKDIIIWNYAKNTHKTLSGHKGGVRTLSLGKNGELISGGSYSGSEVAEDGTIRIWDMEKGKETQLFKHSKYPDCRVENVLMSCRGEIIWSTGNEINCYDYATGKGRWVQKAGNYFNTIGAMRETTDHKIIARVERGDIYIVDPHSGVKLKTIKADSFFDDSLAVTEDRIIYGFKNFIKVLRKTKKRDK